MLLLRLCKEMILSPQPVVPSVNVVALRGNSLQTDHSSHKVLSLIPLSTNTGVQALRAALSAKKLLFHFCSAFVIQKGPLQRKL